MELEVRLCKEVETANQWYNENGMIVNETKHQAFHLFFKVSRVKAVFEAPRAGGPLRVGLCRDSLGSLSFGYSGAVLWNSLPLAARQAIFLNNFRPLLINSDTAFM